MEEYASVGPAPEGWMQKLALALRDVKKAANTYSLPKSIPLVGGMGPGDLLPVVGADSYPKALEALDAGVPLTKGTGMARQLSPEYKEALADMLMAFVPVKPKAPKKDVIYKAPENIQKKYASDLKYVQKQGGATTPEAGEFLRDTGYTIDPGGFISGEIHDAPMQFNKKLVDFLNKRPKLGRGYAEGELAKVIKHPELFQKIPELKDQTIAITQRADGPRGGSYNSMIGGHFPNVMVKGDVNDPGQGGALNIALHEIGHGVSNLRGMGYGSDPDFLAQRFIESGMDPQAAKVFGRELYHKTLDEARQRAVQSRQMYTPEQRRAIPYAFNMTSPITGKAIPVDQLFDFQIPMNDLSNDDMLRLFDEMMLLKGISAIPR